MNRYTCIAKVLLGLVTERSTGKDPAQIFLLGTPAGSFLPYPFQVIGGSRCFITWLISIDGMYGIPNRIINHMSRTESALNL